MPRWENGECLEGAAGLRPGGQEAGRGDQRDGEPGGRAGEGVGSDLDVVSLGWAPQGAVPRAVRNMGLARKEHGTSQRLGGGGGGGEEASCCLTVMELKALWRWVLVTVAQQCERT